MASVKDVWVYPIKGFSRMRVDEVTINDGGTLSGDREYALLDPDVEPTIKDRTDSVGKTFNGKEINHVHEVTTSFDPETHVLTVDREGESEPREFDLRMDRERASEWFSDFVGEPVALHHRSPPSFIDRPKLGPSVISTATLEEVASWFDEMTVEGARRRLRPNVEVTGVPAFWEDRFLGDDPAGFSVDGTWFEGAEACARCVVPSRDPDTGEAIEAFRRRFAERREATLPEWVDTDHFEHFFTVMLITKIPERHHGTSIAVGDEIATPDDRNLDGPRSVSG